MGEERSNLQHYIHMVNNALASCMFIWFLHFGWASTAVPAADVTLQQRQKKLVSFSLQQEGLW